MASGLTVAVSVGSFDPLRDKSYQGTELGKPVVDWLAWMKLGGAAERTLDQYERDLSRACLMYPHLPLDAWTDSECSHVISSWPAASRRVRAAAIDSFFKWAIRTGRLDANPMDRLPRIKRTPQRIIDVFSENEIDDLLGLPEPDSVLTHLLIGAGLRKSEARNLQVRRIKLDTRELLVVGGKGGKDRIVPMTESLAEHVEGFLLVEALEPNDHLWYTRPGGGKSISRSQPVGDSSFGRWWRRVVKTSGVRYRNPHVTRHTFATRWLRRGGRLETLSIVMGHASIRTTFDLYAHLDTRDVFADLLVMEGSG